MVLLWKLCVSAIISHVLRTLKANTLDQHKPSIFNIRNFLLVLLSMPVLALSYYFVFALPAYNQAQLELEREKFKAQQNEQKIKEQVEAEAQRMNKYPLTVVR
jgi:hypothetical protein